MKEALMIKMKNRLKRIAKNKYLLMKAKIDLQRKSNEEFYWEMRNAGISSEDIAIWFGI